MRENRALRKVRPAFPPDAILFILQTQEASLERKLRET